MLIILFFLFNSIQSKSISSNFYTTDELNSFKAIQLKLPNVNLILSAPHSGSDLPDDIPVNRTQGGCKRNNQQCTFEFNDTCSDGVRCPVTTVQDFATFDPFTEQLVDELYRKYRLIPYGIIAKWNRQKIDFNREINEATFNHPKTIQSHQKYHQYLEKAINKIKKKFNNSGLLLDIHQHGQGNYTMVGMTISGAQLNNDNLSSSSIESLIRFSCPKDRSQCIRGTKSLGTFFETHGLGIAYPSSNNPKPNNRTFYKGGYITNHYLSKTNVIQTELSYVVRNGFEPKKYVKKYIKALLQFMKVNKLLERKRKSHV